MIISFFLMTICDVAVYMMFANILSQAVFEGGVPSLAPLLILSAVVSCSSLIYKARPGLRFIPALLLPLCFLWMHNLASAVLLFLPCVYITFIIITKKLSVESERQQRRVRSYAKVVFLPLMSIFLFGYETLVSFYYFHYLLLYIGCAVCVMRLSRTGKKTVLDLKFILINTVVIVGSLVLLVVFGLPQVFGLIWQGVRLLFVSLSNMFTPLNEPELTGAVNSTGYFSIEAFAIEPAAFIPGLPIVLMLLGLMIVIIMFFFVYDLKRRNKDISRSGQKNNKASSLSETRETAAPVSGGSRSGGKQNLFTAKDSRLAVRRHYRQFLIMCAKKGSPPESGDTSNDVNLKNRGNFSERGMHRLRALYIKARYSEHIIEKSDSAEAGELVKHLRGN